MSRFDDLLTDADLRTSRAPLKEPAKRWRNKWRNDGEAGWTLDGFYLAKGEEWWSDYVWPSKEIAEHAALEDIERDIAEGYDPVTHVGAFPDNPEKN